MNRVIQPLKARKSSAPKLKFVQRVRISLSQILGIALITDTLLSALFLPQFPIVMDLCLGMIGVGALWVSFWLWGYYRKQQKQQFMLARA